MAFIAGQYTVTYGTSPGSVGQIKDGIRLTHTVFKQLITGDNMADSPQDAVWRGMECFAQYTLLEYNAAKALSVMWPYGASYGTMGVIGRTDQNLAEPLILTALAGTPAASTPASLTASKAILAEGYPLELLFAPALREVPIRQRLYPNTSGIFFS